MLCTMCSYTAYTLYEFEQAKLDLHLNDLLHQQLVKVLVIVLDQCQVLQHYH
jgi:hypothetical protein